MKNTPSATALRLVTPPPEAVKHRRRPWIIGLIAFVAVVGIGTWVMRWTKARPPAAPTLLLASVDAEPVAAVLRSSGSLAAVETRVVSQPLAGQVAQVRVNEGDVVKAGQILARFDSLALRAELARAEARLVAAEAAGFEAEVVLARLDDDNAPGDDGADAREVARARLATATAEINAREAAYRLAARQLVQGVVRAPASGVVVARRIDPGQTVAAGSPLFDLATDLDHLLLVTHVPEAQMARLRAGLRAHFSVAAYPGRTFAGTVVSLGLLEGPEGARHLPVTLEVDNTARDLAVGMTAMVTIVAREARPTLRVPLGALQFTPRGTRAAPGEPVVWAGDSSGLHRVAVEVGASDGRFVEVRSPRLSSGTTVAVAEARVAGGTRP